MALLENITNHYYKINLDKCWIENCNKAVINIDVYPTLQERQKAKDREYEHMAFFDNCELKIGEYIESLSQHYSEEVENSYINFVTSVAYIKHNLVCNNPNDYLIDVSIINKSIDELNTCGFNSNWVFYPIVKLYNYTLFVNCDDVVEITPSFYYGLLKTQMSDTNDV